MLKNQSGDYKSLTSMNFPEYKSSYPPGVNLKPWSKVHDELIDEINLRTREARRQMAPSYPQWRKTDRTLSAYIPLDQAEELRKNTDSRKPVSIVIPESYATLDTLKSYMVTAFGDSPMFPYIGVDPQDRLSAIMLELVVDRQVQHGKALLPLHTQWHDAFAYGFGVVAARWETQIRRRRIKGEFGDEVKDSIGFEGTVLDAIDPYQYLPDPSTPISRPQDAEFISWLQTQNYMSLMRQEAVSEGGIFNVKYLRNRPTISALRYDENGRESYVDGLGTNAVNDEKFSSTQPVDVVWMYWDLIPNEQGLGPSTQPQKWLFGVAGDEVIISASELDLDHQMYPVAVAAPDATDHDRLPISRIELMSGMQDMMNFLYNSRALTVLKSLRMQLVADPSQINMKDLIAQKGVIRTRHTRWGKGVSDAVNQLKLQDLTVNHISDLLQTRQLTRETTGAMDAIRGVQRTGGERVTAEEFKSTRDAALNRLQTTARIIGLQSMQDLAKMYAYHTQQFMREDTYAKIVGKWEDVLRTEYNWQDATIPVTPYDLDIDFDVDILDGSISQSGNLDTWLGLWQVIASQPELAQTLDISRIFMHIAREAGATNVQDFIKTPNPQMQIAPDESVEDAAQAGNVIPIEEIQNA